MFQRNQGRQRPVDESWSVERITDPVYRTKFVDVPDIIDDWLADYGGLTGKDVLDFGCGEGTMALGIALRKGARRVVGVEVLNVYRQCPPLARQQIGLTTLPGNLELFNIMPGQRIDQFGQFDFIYSWSAFEHVSQQLLSEAIDSIRSALKPGGWFFVQISPLYYSAAGSHLAPWVPEPWAHLSMQHDRFKSALLSAAPTPPDVRRTWSVYIPMDADAAIERAALWDTYTTLNRITAPQLCSLLADAGFTTLRDYRTTDDIPVPSDLAQIYREDVLTTQQIVLLLQRDDDRCAAI